MHTYVAYMTSTYMYMNIRTYILSNIQKIQIFAHIHTHVFSHALSLSHTRTHTHTHTHTHKYIHRSRIV